MAIKLDCISVVIPLEKIRKCLGKESFEKFLRMVDENIGGRVWHDEYLYRDGAMNPLDIAEIVSQWKERGLHPMGGRGDKQHWRDLCVVDRFTGPTLPCDWIEYEEDGGCVYLKGKPKGEMTGPVL